MERNISFSIGPLALMERIESKFNLFGIIFEGLGGKAKNLKKSAKLFMYNKLAESIAICRLKDVYPNELFNEIGFIKEPNERAIYRDLARIGKKGQLILEKYQLFLKRNNLVSSEQFMDFSSSYFEGNPKLGALGYSRDGMPGKKQITFGISTGMNGVPSALTIQKGNIQDKTHFKSLFLTAKKILEIGSMIIFDCGANTNKNKEMIIKSLMNYLTLVQKNKKLYRKYLNLYKTNKKEIFTSNDVKYKCVKISENNVFKYIFYSKKARKEQLKKKAKRFARELAKNDSKILSKVNKGKSFAKFQTSKGIVYAKGEIQKQF